jgi:putative flippase GtrA
MRLNNRLGERLRLMRFGIIGLTAAAIHYWSVVALVELAGAAPLHANVGGFAIAFWCSYFGHRHWTFADRHGIDAARSFFRFLATALLGFLLNQCLFYLLLTYLRLPYFVALAIAVCVVALLTYLLSRIWAFRAPRRPDAPGAEETSR